MGQALWHCCEAVCPQGHTGHSGAKVYARQKTWWSCWTGDTVSMITSLLAKPSLVWEWERTFLGASLAHEDIAAWGGTDSPADGDSCAWSSHEQGWTWLLDLSLRRARGKAARPGPLPVLRDCIETEHPKILLGHFQGSVFLLTEGWPWNTQQHESPEPPAHCWMASRPASRAAAAQVQAVASEPWSGSPRKCSC